MNKLVALLLILAQTGPVMAEGTHYTPFNGDFYLAAKLYPPHTPVDLCKSALHACQGLVEADDSLVKQLQVNNKKLEDALASSSKPTPLLPWILGSILVGVIVGNKVLK